MKLPHIYHPSHGPQTWPWWKLITIHPVRTSGGDPERYFWIKGIAYNIWIYTRWGAVRWTYYHRRSVYRQEEIDRRGWYD